MDMLDVKLCDCAECGKELLGSSMFCQLRELSDEQRQNLPSLVVGRIKGRPYCATCLNLCKLPPGRGTREDDGGPWQQNAVRQLEDTLGD